jgi:hypothetical protein
MSPARRKAEDPRKALEAALAHADDVDFADALMGALGADDEARYARLPDRVRALVAVISFVLEHNAGGIAQVVANSEPRVLADMRMGLAAVGAARGARLLDEARERFPGREFPEDEGERADQLEEIDDAGGGKQWRRLDRQYEAEGENVLRLLRRHVEGRRDELAAALGAAGSR